MTATLPESSVASKSNRSYLYKTAGKKRSA